MNQKRDFEIAFVGLKPGIHEYHFEITDKFFESFQQQDFHNSLLAYPNEPNLFELTSFA